MGKRESIRKKPSWDSTSTPNPDILQRRAISLALGILLGIGIPGITACQIRDRSMPPEVATSKSPAVSPSHKYILAVNYLDTTQGHFYSFQIQNQDGQVLYVSPDRFASRHTTYFLWDTNDRVWVYSGDVGTFFWEIKDDTNKWEKNLYDKNKLPAPEFLRRMRPQFFN